MKIANLKNIKASILLSICIILSSCATWKETEINQKLKTGSKITAKAPAGWMYYTGNRNRIKISKNGPAVHYVSVFRTDYDKINSSKLFIADETPLPVLVDYYSAIVKSRYEGLELQLKGSELVTLNDKAFVKLTFGYTNTEGLRFELTAYSFNYGGYLNEIEYITPVLFLKDRDAEDVYAFIRSVDFEH